MSFENSWSVYPEGLASRGSDSHSYNFQKINSQLQRDSERLFLGPGEPLAVRALEFRNEGQYITTIDSERGIDDYVNPLATCVLRVVMIQQQSSWGRLTISESSMRKLMSSLHVAPAFVDIVASFGARTSYRDASFASLRCHDSMNQSRKELSYLFKQPEKHGRDEMDDEWCIRQFGVWHGWSDVSGHSFIILNPARELQIRLKELWMRNTQPSADDIHIAALSSALDDMRTYVSDIELRYLRMKAKPQVIQVESVQTQPQNKSGAIGIDDIQDIQVLQDKLFVLDHALDADIRILESVSHRCDCAVDSVFEDLISVANSAKGRANSLLKRLSGTIALVTTILDVKCLVSLEYNSRLMAEITRLTHDENASIVELTKKSSRDTDIVKTLTLLALIYLPASLTSSMMGMQYITVSSSSSSVTLHFQGEFWVFLFLTVTLLVFTLGGYAVWYRKRIKSWQNEFVAPKPAIVGP